jgi:guanine nucleotide-binding protein subunit gamma
MSEQTLNTDPDNAVGNPSAKGPRLKSHGPPLLPRPTSGREVDNPQRRSPDSLSPRTETSPLAPRLQKPDPDDPPELQNMPQYTSRDVGDPTQMKKNKQSMADLKLRRLTELNNRLREDLDRERIPVSQAAKR